MYFKLYFPRCGGGGLVCRVQNAQCTAQGKVFPSAYDLRYHYSKHARTALLNKLTKARPYFQNAANKCFSCDVTLPSQDKLVFHIGAKHKEVDSILLEKGIPVPEEEVPAPAKSSSLSSADPSHHSAPPARQASVAETAYEVNYELQCQVIIKMLSQKRLLVFVCLYICSKGLDLFGRKMNDIWHQWNLEIGSKSNFIDLFSECSQIKLVRADSKAKTRSRYKHTSMKTS